MCFVSPCTHLAFDLCAPALQCRITMYLYAHIRNVLLATWQLPDYRKTMPRLNHNLYSYNVEHIIFEVMGYFVLPATLHSYHIAQSFGSRNVMYIWWFMPNLVILLCKAANNLLMFFPPKGFMWKSTSFSAGESLCYVV